MGTRDPISIQGIVIGAEWAPNGDLTAIDIAGYDEKRYRVVDDRIGRKLRVHIKKKVSVDGALGTENGNQVLFIERFDIENPDDSNPLVPGNTEKSS